MYLYLLGKAKNVKDGSGSVYQFLQLFVNLGATQVNRCTVDSFNH